MELGTGVPSKIDHVDVDSFFLHPTRPVRLSTKPQLSTLPPSVGPHHLSDTARHRSPSLDPVPGACHLSLSAIATPPAARDEGVTRLGQSQLSHLEVRFPPQRSTQTSSTPTAQPSTTALARPPARPSTHSPTHPRNHNALTIHSRHAPPPVCSPLSPVRPSARPLTHHPM